MKIKIKDLHANPYRRIQSYPINRDKVQQLMDSINQTCFWDNILARKANGKIQIAYGHHRLVALREVFGPDHEVDIPVKPLDDATMIKIMANENMEEWRPAPGVIDETVKVAKEFLEANLDEFKKVSKLSFLREGKAGSEIISRFLGWQQSRVGYSLQRLGLIEKEVLDKKAVESMPTDHAARTFTEKVKEFKPDSAAQKRVAKRIIESGSTSEEEMERQFIADEMRNSPQDKSAKKDPRVIEFERFLKDCIGLSRSLNQSFLALLDYKDIMLAETYFGETKDLYLSMTRLIKTFEILMKGVKKWEEEKTKSLKE